MSHHRRDLFFDWSTNFQPQSWAGNVLSRAAGRFFRNDRPAAVTRRPARSSAARVGVGGFHRTPDLADRIRQRVREVEEDLYAHLPGLNELLCLLVLGGVGRAHVLGIGEVTADAVFQIFPAHDLETFALPEGGNSLALFRFSREAGRARERMMVQSWSPLDEFGLYRRHNHTFYASDDLPPNVLSVATDFSGALHCQYQEPQ